MKFVSVLGAVALSLLLSAGCGPGVVGTGTGASDVGEVAFGASERPVCSAEFNGTIGCNRGQVTEPLPRPAFFEGGKGADLVQARFDENNLLVLRLPCTGFEFEGRWGATERGDLAFYGAQILDGGATLRAARVQVEVVEEGLQFTVEDTAQQVLLGPVSVVKVDAFSTPQCR